MIRGNMMSVPLSLASAYSTDVYFGVTELAWCSFTCGGNLHGVESATSSLVYHLARNLIVIFGCSLKLKPLRHLFGTYRRCNATSKICSDRLRGWRLQFSTGPKQGKQTRWAAQVQQANITSIDAEYKIARSFHEKMFIAFADYICKLAVPSISMNIHLANICTFKLGNRSR